jgi:hypothetical protein
MLEIFCRGVSEQSRIALHDSDHPFPFANLEWPPGVRKRHGIDRAREGSEERVRLPVSSVSPRRDALHVTLHEEIIAILRVSGRFMTAPEIASEVSRRGQYSRSEARSSDCRIGASPAHGSPTSSDVGAQHVCPASTQDAGNTATHATGNRAPLRLTLRCAQASPHA